MVMCCLYPDTVFTPTLGRRWLLTSYLLPRDIPIFADVSLGVKAHNDKVWWLSGK